MDCLFSKEDSNLDLRLRRFRVASRELFNTYFALPEPWKNAEGAWRREQSFSEVEAVMFNAVVLGPEKLALIEYGRMHPQILVKAAPNVESLPAKINRERDSGYWDFDIAEIPVDATLTFISFFDWSQLDLRDNEFAKLFIRDCSSLPILAGRQALVRPTYIAFVKGS